MGDETRPPKCSPEYILSMLSGFRQRYGNSRRFDEFEAIARDPRMGELWEWLESVRFERLDTFRNAWTVVQGMKRYTRQPGKPGNMPPASRAKYLEKVRKHVVALRELLENTRFDRDGEGLGFEALTDDDLQTPLRTHLDKRDMGEDQPSRQVVAFRWGEDTSWEMLDWSYPESAFTDTLADIHEWTYWDDQWDGSIFLSSAPIAQSSTSRTQVGYFACMMHDWFKRYGVDLPFRMLATAANVALQLRPDAQVDEDTVRKQVRRYEARKESRAESQTSADLDPPF